MRKSIEGGIGNSDLRRVNSAGFTQISTRFFETAGIPVRLGRDFTDSDSMGRPRVAIVSERAASLLWSEQNPLGRTLRVAGEGAFEVVGVVANTATGFQDPAPGAHVYVPLSQRYSPKVSLLVRSHGDPKRILEPLRAIVNRQVPEVPLVSLTTLADGIAVLGAPIRAAALVLGLLALLGVGIALLGVYGVVAYSASQRQREFGVRRALGATDLQVHLIAIRQAVPGLMAGLSVEILVALAGAGLLRHLLYGVQPYDPLTFIGAPVVLVLDGLLSSFVAARRGTRIDPSALMKDCR
jgi:putative ABC transport system permease protein